MIKFAYFGEKPGNKHIFRNSCRETSTSSETHASDDSKSPTECMQNGLSKGVKDFVYYDPESNECNFMTAESFRETFDKRKNKAEVWKNIQLS